MVALGPKAIPQRRHVGKIVFALKTLGTTTGCQFATRIHSLAAQEDAIQSRESDSYFLIVASLEAKCSELVCGSGSRIGTSSTGIYVTASSDVRKS